MPLYVVATPIGNPEDITVRAQRYLDEAEVIIGEEAKPTRKLLKGLGISPKKPIELLNEHTDRARMKELAEICKQQKVALVSDCGTPAFCDPGANLVAECAVLNIQVISSPGASSLMAFFSIAGHRFSQFWFEGFLPANTEKREHRLRQLSQTKTSILFMDTPYRLQKTIKNCEKFFPERQLILGLNLSKENESVLRGQASKVLKSLKVEKAEFILAVL